MDQVESTNDEAKRLAEEGAEEGTLVWAREQTKGRGRQNRGFESPPGNLYMSLLLRPECSAREAAQLGFVAALGVGDGVGSAAPPMIEVHYKWPNDVLFNGRKGCGILLESKIAKDGGLDWLVLGMGVNLASFPEGTSFPATSLKFEGAPPNLTVERLLEAISRHFLTWVHRWRDEGFGPIRQTWLRHAKGMGEPLEVRLSNERLHGTFQALDESGALVLALPGGGTRLIHAGDVYFA